MHRSRWRVNRRQRKKGDAENTKTKHETKRQATRVIENTRSHQELWKKKRRKCISRKLHRKRDSPSGSLSSPLLHPFLRQKAFLLWLIVPAFSPLLSLVHQPNSDSVLLLCLCCEFAHELREMCLVKKSAMNSDFIRLPGANIASVRKKHTYCEIIGDDSCIVKQADGYKLEHNSPFR